MKMLPRMQVFIVWFYCDFRFYWHFLMKTKANKWGFCRWLREQLASGQLPCVGKILMRILGFVLSLIWFFTWDSSAWTQSNNGQRMSRSRRTDTSVLGKTFENVLSRLRLIETVSGGTWFLWWPLHMRRSGWNETWNLFFSRLLFVLMVLNLFKNKQAVLCPRHYFSNLVW